MIKIVIFILIASIATISFAKSVDIYFGTAGEEAKGIYRATFDPTSGKLTPAKLAAEISRPGFLAMHPKRTTLYAVASVREGPCVAAYRILEDGKLSLLNTAQIGDGGGAHLSVHPSGKFLLTAQYGGGSVGVFALAKDGSLMKRTALMEHEGGSGVVEGRQDSPHPHWTGFSPDGRYAFVPDLGLDQIVIYKVDDSKGSIEPHGVGHSVPGGGPRHMRFSVDGKFIYLLNELPLSVSTFEYHAANGAVKRLTTTPALSEEAKAQETFNSASEILVHPSGKFVYSANRGNDSVTAYRANPNTGELTVTEVEPIRGAWPRNINLDTTGKWLLAAGAHSNTISVFEIDQENGKLSYQRQSIIDVPGCICIVIND